MELIDIVVAVLTLVAVFIVVARNHSPIYLMRNKLKFLCMLGLMFISCNQPVLDEQKQRIIENNCNACLKTFKNCDVKDLNSSQLCLTKKTDSLKKINQVLLKAIKNKLQNQKTDIHHNQLLTVELNKQITLFKQFQETEINFFNIKYNNSSLATNFNLELITYNLCFLNNKLSIINLSIP